MSFGKALVTLQVTTMQKLINNTRLWTEFSFFKIPIIRFCRHHGIVLIIFVIVSVI